MKPTREYVSPDNQLRFVVDHDEQDVRLGFEGSPWHNKGHRPSDREEHNEMPGPIALKLRLLREERNLTPKEAAKLANVYHRTLIYLESGKRAPYMPTVTKIARAYGVSVEELVEEE